MHSIAPGIFLFIWIMKLIHWALVWWSGELRLHESLMSQLSDKAIVHIHMWIGGLVQIHVEYDLIWMVNMLMWAVNGWASTISICVRQLWRLSISSFSVVLFQKIFVKRQLTWCSFQVRQSRTCSIWRIWAQQWNILLLSFSHVYVQ